MAERFDLTAIVLAAGRSTRMQQHNKLLLPWGAKRIAQVVVETVLSVAFEEVVVVVGHQRDSIQELLADYPLRLVYNPGYAEGLSTSVARGVEAAGPQTAGYLFALGDMPRMAPQTIARLCQAFFQGATDTIAVPTVEERRGNPVIFSRSYRSELLQLEGDRGARPLVHKHAEKVVEVEVEDPGIFADVDTPETYRCSAPQQN